MYQHGEIRGLGTFHDGMMGHDRMMGMLGLSVMDRTPVPQLEAVLCLEGGRK